MTTRPWKVLIPADVAEERPRTASFADRYGAEHRAFSSVYGDTATTSVAMVYNAEDDNHRLVIREGMETVTEFWTGERWTARP